MTKLIDRQNKTRHVDLIQKTDDETNNLCADWLANNCTIEYYRRCMLSAGAKNRTMKRCLAAIQRFKVVVVVVTRTRMEVHSAAKNGSHGTYCLVFFVLHNR